MRSAMYPYQKMPTPANEVSPPDGQFRCLQMLLCFRHHRPSDKQAIDRFVGKDFEAEQKDDNGPPTEESSESSKPEIVDSSKPENVEDDSSKRKTKKKLFTIPKRFPTLKLRNGTKKKAQNASMGRTIF